MWLSVWLSVHLSLWPVTALCQVLIAGVCAVGRSLYFRWQRPLPVQCPAHYYRGYYCGARSGLCMDTIFVCLQFLLRLKVFATFTAADTHRMNTVVGLLNQDQIPKHNNNFHNTNTGTHFTQLIGSCYSATLFSEVWPRGKSFFVRSLAGLFISPPFVNILKIEPIISLKFPSGYPFQVTSHDLN